MTKLTILIPVYNEEKIIEQTLKKVNDFLERYEPDSEILAVDDGSADNTVAVVKKCSEKMSRIRIVAHEHNMGIGAALRTGLKNAVGEIIVTLDSDLTYSTDEIPKLIEKLEKEKLDIVIGTPYLNRSDAKEMPFFRYVLSKGANLVDKLIFGLNFTTPTCFFRAWRKEAAKQVEITFNRFEGVPESAINAYRKGYKIGEAPAYYNLKRKGTSQDAVRDLIKHLQMILTVRCK